MSDKKESVWASSVVVEWRVARELSAEVDGLGIASDKETNRGTRSSMVSLSGGGARGDNRGKVRLCNCRV